MLPAVMQRCQPHCAAAGRPHWPLLPAENTCASRGTRAPEWRRCRHLVALFPVLHDLCRESALWDERRRASSPSFAPCRMSPSSLGWPSSSKTETGSRLRPTFSKRRGLALFTGASGTKPRRLDAQTACEAYARSGGRAGRPCARTKIAGLTGSGDHLGQS